MNKFEAEVASQIKRAKAKFSYETEKIPYVLARHYIPDFIIQTKYGKIYIECKGYFRPEHKAKMAAVKRQHPELDIRMLFQVYRLKDVKWAEKHGFKYAVKDIPKEWFKQ